MKNYMDALKRRKENGEAGFSLIELIVVVVILGVLAAIAIPVFLNLQGDAEQNALETVAANGATQAASSLAQGITAPDFSNLENDGQFTVSLTTDSGTTIDDFCVTANRVVNPAAQPALSGPGC